jgi:hypothetical protein
MAEKYAVVSGNWSDPATWDGGVKPVAGDTVHSNNYTVSLDEDATVDLITNKAGTTAVAGGKFVLAANITITADIEAGPATCVENNFGTLNIIGDITGGGGVQFYGVRTFANRITNHTGNSTGGTSTLAMGHQVEGECNMTGDAYGGTGNVASGIRVTGECYHTGRAIGTAQTGTVVAGGYYEVSEVTSSGVNYGLDANTGESVVSVIRQTGLLFPARGNFHFVNDASQIQIIVHQQDTSEVTLTDATAAANYPSESEVESGVVFGNTDQFTGTLQTVDAAQLASDLLDEMQTSSHVIAQRLRASATDDSVGEIVSSTLGG